MTEPLIRIENLQTFFFTDEGVAKAVDDVSLVIPQGRTLGLVGESGCGKSVTALSIMRLISPPAKSWADGSSSTRTDTYSSSPKWPSRTCARSAAGRSR